MIKKPPETYRAFLDRLEDLVDQNPPENVKEAEDELRDAGLDPEVVGQRMKAIADRSIARARASWWAEAAAQRRSAVANITRFTTHIPDSRPSIEAAIRDILQQSPGLKDLPAISAHFRNFAEATDEDLKSLLLELEFLRLETAKDSKDKDK
jgi:hypothetical protein